MDRPGRDALQTTLPAYEVGDELGRGAFGVVWAGRHTQLGREVAIKQLPEAFASDETVRGRFVDEARTVAALDHPHIVPVYDFVENSTACLLIMERCADSVGDRFKASGIATDEACAAVLACLAALDHAHARGVLHRDVKPENLMYDRAGTVKLADFGIARALHHDVRRTATGMVVGTPAYMSPEQVRGDTLTPASDVYSVAMMAYELLTGSLPFPESDSVNGLLAHHLVTEPLPLLSTRPELPGGIGAAVDRALAKDLSVRPGTAMEFATELSAGSVSAFGSGWLRRRRFTLHWPDIVAENERSGPSTPRTGTIVVQAQHGEHEVITPSAALAGEVKPLDFPPPRTPPAAPGVPAVPPPNGAGPGMPVPPQLPPTPPARGGRALLLGGIAAAVVVVLIAAAAGVLLLSGGDDESSSPDDTVPVEEADRDEDAEDDTVDDDGSEEVEAADEVVDTPDSVPTTEPTPEPTTEPTPEPTVDPNIGTAPDGIGNPPEDFDPQDASVQLEATPCPVEQPRHACIFAGVVTDTETDQLLFNYFTGGFVPDIDGGGDRVHFYFDTAVNGDENAAGSAAGTAGPGGTFVEWDLPAIVDGNNLPDGRTLFTLADAEAVDARHLCVTVADADGVAIPGTGNCSPLWQVWDFNTFPFQTERPTGRWIGGCDVGVSAIVPEGWGAVDLTSTSPEDAAAELFAGDIEAATQALAALVDNGAVLFATGEDRSVVISSFVGDITLDATPAEVDAFFAALGRTGDTQPTQLIDRQVPATTNDNGTTVTAIYRIPDFGKAFEVAVSAPSGTEMTDLGYQFASTVVGC